jgi:hypothetical protein
MNVKKFVALLLALPLVFIVGYAHAVPTYYTDLENCYHGTLGHLNTPLVTDHEQGMLEKWCALPNLTMLEDGFCNAAGVPPCAGTSWMNRCGSCHIGGAFGSLTVIHPNEGAPPGTPYPVDPGVPVVNCLRCHPAAGGTEPWYPADMQAPTVALCMSCHGKEKAKRGFNENDDVHIVDQGMLCQDCHVRMDDAGPPSDHQLAKGCVIDTSMLTWWDTMSVAGTDCVGCHTATVHTNTMLNQHAGKIACETCHTGQRRGDNVALLSRSWQSGGMTNVKHNVPWLPVLKWYDGGGPLTSYPAMGHLPILNDHDELKTPRAEKVFDAKIFPFSDISVTWWLKNTACNAPTAPYDDIIPNSVVAAATAFFGGTPTQAQMRTYDHDGDTVADYPCALLMTDTVCFNVTHSVQPKEEAFRCNDCHIDGVSGEFDDGWDSTKWSDLGYSGDPMALMGTTTIEDVEMSYHGHLGHLSISDDGVTGSGPTWTTRCGGCHIGGKFDNKDLTLGVNTWTRDPVRLTVDCARCHNKAGGELTAPTNDKCMSCHGKEIAKRGYDQTKDVHMVDHGMLCQDCHFRFTDADSDHQLAKGTVLDTSMEIAKDTMDGGCSAAACHGPTPHTHPVFGGTLNTLHTKIACETCHTGLRKGGLALKTRSWQSGAVANTKRGDYWVPFHKWYDGSGSPTTWPADGHLPILSADEMKDNPGAKIYPFNNIEVTWWLKNTGRPAEPPYDDVIPNTVAAAATTFFGGTPTQAQMRSYDYDGDTNPDYPDAKLVTDTVSFNVSHSVEASFTCGDCHGWANYVMEWADLGYPTEPPVGPGMCAQILKVKPRPAHPLERVRLLGTMFGDSQDDFGDPREVTRVVFKVPGKGSIKLRVKSWSDTKIVVKIPGTAKLVTKFGSLPVTGKVFIKNGKNKSNRRRLRINP